MQRVLWRMNDLPPTVDEVMQNNSPEWLRQQADLVEKQAHEIAEQLRTRADSIENRVRQVKLSRELINTNKARAANEIRLKNLREADQPNAQTFKR